MARNLWHRAAERALLGFIAEPIGCECTELSAREVMRHAGAIPAGSCHQLFEYMSRMSELGISQFLDRDRHKYCTIFVIRATGCGVQYAMLYPWTPRMERRFLVPHASVMRGHWLHLVLRC